MKFKEYLAYLEEHGKSPETVASYSYTYAAFSEAYAELNTETARAFLSQYGNPATFNKALNHLRSYWNWGQRMGFIQGGLMVEQRRVPLRLPQTVDDEYYIKVLSHLNNSKIIGARQTAAFLAIKRNTGMRFSEIRNLRASHWVGDNYIKFIGKGNAERIVTLNQMAQEYLALWISLGEQFGYPGSSNIRHHLKKAEEATGVMHIRPHWVRHTVATNLDAQNVPIERIADLLGNTVEVVRARYRRMNVQKLKEVTDLL